jgi:hypothetical protein
LSLPQFVASVLQSMRHHLYCSGRVSWTWCYGRACQMLFLHLRWLWRPSCCCPWLRCNDRSVYRWCFRCESSLHWILYIGQGWFYMVFKYTF